MKKPRKLVGNKNQIHIAKAQKTPVRLQEYGVGIFPTITTKSALKKALKKELISIDGKLAKTATFIYGGEVIRFNTPPEERLKRPFVLKLEIIYEDDYLAVIHKPSGILVSGNRFKTIANALLQNLKKSKQVDAIKPQPAHRLDFGTSGLLLIGKTSSSLTALNRQFENKKIEKCYYAIAIGTINNHGTLNTQVDHKEAIANFEVLQTIPSERFNYLNLVRLKPETGRRHQLREQLSAIGNPILGDANYGIDQFLLKGKGLYLHAFSLKFIHPITAASLYFEKELPSKFKKLFSRKTYKYNIDLSSQE